ncbi:MAG: 4'-phosphopantetheinyl transferase superfamily protein [Gelidibacter sp.]
MYSNLFYSTIEVQDSAMIQENQCGVILYKIQLSEYQELVPDLIHFLSTSEHHRANRYHFEKDKNRFVICRALLKFLLAEHLDLEIAQILLDIDSNKKPYFAAHPSVFFNVSHAGDYALIAITKSPIGVDIEYVNKSFDYKEILPNICSITEIDEVNQSTDKPLSFYKLWTRKEAIVKAIGKGIDDDLPKIPVTDGFHSVTSALVCGYKKITIFSFNVDYDYVGAIAFTKEIINSDKIVFTPLPTSTELRNSIFK